MLKNGKIVNDIYKSAMDVCGFADSYSLNADVIEAYENLIEQPEIFVYLAHGLEGMLVTYTSKHEDTGFLAVNEKVKNQRVEQYLADAGVSSESATGKRILSLPAKYVQSISNNGISSWNRLHDMVFQ